MPKGSAENSASPIWIGKPWVLPGVIARTIFIVIIAVAISWLELALGVGSVTFLNLQVILWTSLLFLLIWIFSVLHLVLLRASNAYALRSDSLEVRAGILSTKTFVVAPSGFSDLEVDRSISGRIVDSGDIIIRTQSENDVMMVRVREPLKVAERIRKIMARPIVRIETRDSAEEQ